MGEGRERPESLLRFGGKEGPRSQLRTGRSEQFSKGSALEVFPSCPAGPLGRCAGGIGMVCNSLMKEMTWGVALVVWYVYQRCAPEVIHYL